MLHFLRLYFRRRTSYPRNTPYTAYVRPNLELPCALWDPYEQYLIDDLEIIKNWSARFFTGVHNRRKSVSAQKKKLLYLKPLSSRRKSIRLKLLHNISYGSSGRKKNFLFPPHSISSHRNHAKKRKYYFKTYVWEFSFFLKTMNQWISSLREVAHFSSNPSLFLKGLKCFLMTRNRRYEKCYAWKKKPTKSVITFPPALISSALWVIWNKLTERRMFHNVRAANGDRSAPSGGSLDQRNPCFMFYLISQLKIVREHQYGGR